MCNVNAIISKKPHCQSQQTCASAAPDSFFVLDSSQESELKNKNQGVCVIAHQLNETKTEEKRRGKRQRRGRARALTAIEVCHIS